MQAIALAATSLVLGFVLGYILCATILGEKLDEAKSELDFWKYHSKF